MPRITASKEFPAYSRSAGTAVIPAYLPGNGITFKFESRHIALEPVFRGESPDVAPRKWLKVSSSDFPLSNVLLTMPTEYQVGYGLSGGIEQITVNWRSQTAKTFLGAPNAANGIPSFRQVIPSDIGQAGATLLQVIAWNGTAWAPTSVAGIGAITSLNGLTAAIQTFATGTSGTDFNIASAVSTHTFNLPIASAVNTGKLSAANWTTFNNKVTAVSVASAGGTINVITGGTVTNPTFNLEVASPYPGIPTLQQVTNTGNTTTDDVIFTDGAGTFITIDPTRIRFTDAGTGFTCTFSYASLTAGRSVNLPDEDGTLIVDAPADGNTYGRNNNAWVTVGSSSFDPANTLFVATSGGDYTSIQSAITAATSGQLVFVFPGTYSETITLKNGVNLYFTEGAILSYTVNVTTPLMTDGGVAVTSRIGGYGQFSRTGSSNATGLIVSHASSSVTIEGKSLTTTGSSSEGMTCTAGALHVKGMTISAGASGVEYSTSTTGSVTDCVITSTANYGILSSGTGTFDNCTVSAAANSAIHTAAGTHLITNCRMTTSDGNYTGLEKSGGVTTVRNCTITNTGNLSTGHAISNYGGSELVLDDVSTSCVHASAYSIYAGGSGYTGDIRIESGGLFGNRVIDPLNLPDYGTFAYANGGTTYDDSYSGGIRVQSLTASRVVVTGASKELASSATTATEIGYVSGVTSAIQTQLDAKADSAPWVDYYASSTVTGWSVFTVQELHYKILDDDCIMVHVRITGTSNSTSTSFTLPFNADATTSYRWVNLGINNGTGNDKLYFLDGATNTVNVSNSATSSGVAWTASGTKSIVLTFFYMKA